MPPVATLQGSGQDKTPYGNVGRPPFKILSYKGSYGATVTEQTVDVIPVDAYRSILFSMTASSWGTATVVIKVYPCDSAGGTDVTNTSAIISQSFTANAGPKIVWLSEMGGATSSTTFPSAAASSGSVVGPLGNFIKITETCSSFSSGTNTVAISVEMKG